MSHRIIRELFDQRLESWAALHAIRVAEENTAFDPAPGETWLSTALVATATDSQSLAGEHRVYTGAYQVTVRTAANGGTAMLDEVLEALEGLFPPDFRLRRDGFSALVLSNEFPPPTGDDPPHDRVTVRIQYRADTP